MNFLEHTSSKDQGLSCYTLKHIIGKQQLGPRLWILMIHNLEMQLHLIIIKFDALKFYRESNSDVT